MSVLLSFLLVSSSLLVIGSSVYADGIENENGLEITNSIYNNLNSLGFTDEEIKFMGPEAYEANKDLKGEVVAEETQYLKIIEPTDTSGLNRKTADQNVLKANVQSVTIELDEETYFEELAKEAAKENQISVMDIRESKVTSYKIMNTVIARLGVQNYRLKQSVAWSSMPNNRKIDVTGIGLNTFWSPTSNSNYGEQKWTTYNHLDGKRPVTKTYGASSTSWSKGSGGYALRIDLPNDEVGGGAGATRVETLQNYIYYDVRPIATNNKLDGYGHYAHQETTFTVSPSISLTGLSLGLSPYKSFTYHPNTHVEKFNP